MQKELWVLKEDGQRNAFIGAVPHEGMLMPAIFCAHSEEDSLASMRHLVERASVNVLRLTPQLVSDFNTEQQDAFIAESVERGAVMATKPRFEGELFRFKGYMLTTNNGEIIKAADLLID